MAISTAFYGNNSISTTEFSLTANSTSLGSNTSAGIYQCFIDFANLTVSEQYEFKVYEQVSNTSAQRVVYRSYAAGVQAQPIFASPSLVLMNGWEMSLDKLAGTDRNIVWSIRKVG